MKYLLVVWSNPSAEPKIFGPFNTENDRTNDAQETRIVDSDAIIVRIDSETRPELPRNPKP